MALSLAAPRLRVIEGSKHNPRHGLADEADIEFMAFCDEVLREMEAVVQAEIGMDIPNGYVIQRATRIARKALLAKGEIKRLRGPDNAA